MKTFYLVAAMATLTAPMAAQRGTVRVDDLARAAERLAADVGTLDLDGARQLGSLRDLAEAADLASLSSLSSLQSLASLRSLSSLESLDGLAALDGLSGFSGLPRASRRGANLPLPRVESHPDDPADSLYRAARAALNRDDYKRAADLFHRVNERYPDSQYAADAMYFEAFALFRTGDEDNLRQATDVLRSLRSRFPKATVAGDASVLLTRVEGALAKQGDASAAENLAEQASGKSRGAGKSRGGRGMGSGAGAGAGCPTGDDDDDVRVAALNALMQMDAERALPILKTVLARRDECSQPLRKKAVFLVAQKHSDETADILLDVARRDPDGDVRADAVFWMSQVPSERTLAALDSVLLNSKDAQLQDKAIFALSQHQSPRAQQLLRDFAMSSGASEELRGQAIFWIGNGHRSPETSAFLRELYAKISSDDLREKIIQGVSQNGNEDDRKWLVGLVGDAKQPVEVRKKAIFWLGQQKRTSVSDIAAMYDGLKEQEIKEQVIFALSQRNEAAAVDKLIDIAKHEQVRELRKKAIFWLGQSNDPRVKALLVELINQ